jgi:aspartyl-tRNA(Asn)/glutamyl-tRNA(Gln) amidotransferase subunit A
LPSTSGRTAAPNPLDLGIQAAAARLRDGSLTSERLVRDALARSDANAGLGAYAHRMDDAALKQAAAADAELASGHDRGPLHGLPVGIKDLIAVADAPTRGQSLVHDLEWGGGQDAPVVARLRDAGAVITGKLATMEFGVGPPDPEKPFAFPRNPWDPNRWAGGSSSGAGIAVAARMVVGAVGTDTGGSIRIPAAFCGVTGLMPTYGLVPTDGCIPLGFSLDHVGPLARTASDCGALLEVLAGRDLELAPATAPAPSLDGLRIGVDVEQHLDAGDAQAAWSAFDRAMGVFRSRGAEIIPISIAHYAETMTAHRITLVSEALAYQRQELASRWGDFHAGTRVLFAQGALFSGADYVQAQRVRQVAQRALARQFTEVDIIATPTSTQPAPTFDVLREQGIAPVMEALRTLFWDAVGHPVMAVPIGFTGDPLPVSMQLAGPPHSESRLIEIARTYQADTDWHRCLPPLTG